MATCANCNNAALYTYKVNDSYGIDYCQYHLPNFLNGLTDSLVVAATDELKSLQAEVVADSASSKKKKADAIVEPVVEDAPVVEETAVEDAPTTDASTDGTLSDK